MSNEEPNQGLSHSSDSCSPDIEELLHKAELENSEHVKLIQAENQRHAALQRQLEAKTRQIEELEKSTKQLDEEAKLLHKHFKQNREICESLKKTNHILNEHEETIQRKTEGLRIKAQKEDMKHKTLLEKYRKTWERYHEVYESDKVATGLRQTKEKTQKLKEQVMTIAEKIGEMNEGIRRIEMKNDAGPKTKEFNSAVKGILKLAELYLDGRKKAGELKTVREKIKSAERVRQANKAREAKKAANGLDGQLPHTPMESEPTDAVGQRVEVPAVDDAINSMQNVIPPPSIWSNVAHSMTSSSHEAPSHSSPPEGSENREELTTQLSSSELSTKTSVSYGSHSKPNVSPEVPANASLQTAVCTMEEDTGQHAASNPSGFHSLMSQLQRQLTPKAARSQNENAEVIPASPAPQVDATPSAENTRVQNPASPSPSARTANSAKSPFSLAVHSQRVEQLTKSPGEGFLFQGRAMFNGTEDQSSDVSMPGFFQSFLDTSSQQGQATNFGCSELSVSSPNTHKESRTTSGSSGSFFSGSNMSSSTKTTMSLFGSPVRGQENSTAHMGEPRPQLFQMFEPTSSPSKPPSSVAQQSQPSFSLNFGSPARAENTQDNRPVFSLF